MAGADGHKPKGSVGHVRTLVVKPGDTLWRIARAHGVSIPDLQQLNGLTSSLIRVGQRLKVPMVSERTHEVSSAPAPAPTQSRPSSPNPKTSRGDASRTDTTTDPTASQSRDHQRTD
ncbi:MAG: LysM peptidoglycan-binding domain-containing protein [Nitrospirae bacterium]|nr:MAG: LysM peptidoglycan-binding domain-containing protein [Nitrospirota bacterium]